jgi:hypothetical protein
MRALTLSQAFSRALPAAVLFFGLGLNACSPDLGAPAPTAVDDTGSIGVALTAAPGVTFSGAAYTITGPAGFTKSGPIDLSSSASVAASLAGIPAGTGYAITVTTNSAGASQSCIGTASFAVVAHATTAVMIKLSCHEPPKSGSVIVSGALNVCARIKGINSSPGRAAVGQGLVLGASWADSDGGPMPLVFQWTTSAGATLDSATSRTPKLTCTAVGTVTVSLTLSDGDPAPGCTDAASIQVTCLDPAVAECSFPSRPEGAACDDHNGCTTGEACHAGVCSGGTSITCAATDSCHDAGVCNPSSGLCSNPAKANGTSCNDGSLCTSGDACQAGACSGTAITCAGGADACHPGVCDAATGSCVNPNACTLYGTGNIPSNTTDGIVGNNLLEDGTPNNQLGALGSAIAYTGSGNRYVLTPDRGPNAGLDSYDERYYLVDLSLAGGVVTPSVVGGATLNKSAGLTLNGLNSGYDATNSAAGSRRFDAEGVRVTPAGTFWVSDEYGPFLSEFSADGNRLRFINLPSKFLITNPQPGDAELPPVNTVGRVVNRGMEGLAISPDGHRLYGLMQNGIMQDGELDAANKRVGTHNRLIEFNADTGLPLREFVYNLDNKDYGCNELLAVNDHQFLVIERDGNAGTAAAFKKLMLIDIAGATDVSGMASLSPATGSIPGVTPVSKQPFLDLLSPTFGLAGASFPEKIEGIAFGPDQPDGRHTLVVTNDNDFLTTNPNNFYVFLVSPTALPAFQSQIATFSNLCANVICPAPADACHLPGTCNPGTGTCSSPPAAAGTAVGSQTAGDCHKSQCDGAGHIVAAVDDTDVPNDGNSCTQDSCSAGNPVFTPAAINTACAQSGGSFCDGAGACVACNSASQCAGSDTECQTRTCSAHACGMAFVPNGQALAAQTAGDCHQLQCNGAGGTTSAVDDGDVPVDGNQCTADVCTAGTPSNPATVAGSSCGGGVCNGAGMCTGCGTAADCPGVDSACASRTCTAGACGMAFVAAGTDAGGQTAGDCHKNVCDGAGNQISDVDSSDVPVDGNQCTGDVCSGGTPSNPFLPAASACNASGGNSCDGAGACVPTFRVVRVGTGAAALSNASTAVFIEERRSDAGNLGVLLNTLALPTAASGANQPLTMSGSASSEGALSLSTDGHALALAGYATAPGLTGVASTSTTGGSAVLRVAGRIAAGGAIDTSTVLGTNFTGNNVRGALANPTGLWVVGAAGGVYFAPLGSSDGGVLVSSTSTNNRTVNAWGGQLYGSSASGSFFSVFTVGSGLPTTGPQTAVALPGMPTASGPSPYAFVLLDRNPAVAGIDTAYVADDRAAASGGGVQKWILASPGGSWSAAGTMNVNSATQGIRGLSGSVSGGAAVLFATTADNVTRLVMFTDTAVTAMSATSSILATSATNTLYRGVALSPVP